MRFPFGHRDLALILSCLALLSLGVRMSLRQSDAGVEAGPAPTAFTRDEEAASPRPRPRAATPRTTWRRLSRSAGTAAVPMRSSRTLRPVPNPDPALPAQPERCHPSRVAVSRDGRKAYVTLSGKEISPGSEVSVIDLASRREVRRIPVGSRPFAVVPHPSGRWMVVTCLFTNALSVIDTSTDRVVSEVPVPFYCEDLVFDASGKTAYVSNFWLNQVLVVDLTVRDGRLQGSLRSLGFDRAAFDGNISLVGSDRWYRCRACGWLQGESASCSRCGKDGPAPLPGLARVERHGGVRAILRARCGTAACHLEASGGFYAGPDPERLFLSARTHAIPGDPDGSPLLRSVTPRVKGGRADTVDGRHHPGGTVFDGPQDQDDLEALRAWIADAVPGPGIPVGDKPRDLVLSPDGRTLFVANTGSLDVSVVDLEILRETRRIFTRSPVNDLLFAGQHLILATLGVGSGHPKARHPGRESTDRDGPETEFTLFRDLDTGRPLPLAQQSPLGPYDDVDGTAQEKFRDITNDMVILDPRASTVAAYRADELFTRYTSDSFEALAGDKKGDVPPELMKVVGAFPEQAVLDGERLYVTMSGTFQVQSWRVNPSAADAYLRMEPLRVYETGLKPQGIALAGSTLVVADNLSESLTFIDTETGASSQLSLSRLADPFPSTDFERGEFFVQTSVYSVDQDQSCVHCHYRDTSDGKRWSVSQVMGQSRDGEERTGGSREVPDLRALVQKVPFFLEGTLSIDEPLTMMMEHNPLIDFQGETPAGDFRNIFASGDEQAQYSRSADMIVVATGKKWSRTDVSLADLRKRRDLHFRRTSRKYLGGDWGLRDLQRFIGAYQRGEPRLLPNPVDPSDPRVVHGRLLFESPAVGCSSCHPAPTFTDKVHVHNENRAFPPLVTAAPRDNVHTLISADRLDAINGFVRPWDAGDPGRVEATEGFFVAPSLRGLWARPPRFLHHGHALSLREVLCPPGHPALRSFPFDRLDAPRPGRRERGFNERDGVPDTHGATSHLSTWDIECLILFLQSIG